MLRLVAATASSTIARTIRTSSRRWRSGSSDCEVLASLARIWSRVRLGPTSDESAVAANAESSVCDCSSAGASEEEFMGRAERGDRFTRAPEGSLPGWKAGLMVSGYSVASGPEAVECTSR